MFGETNLQLLIKNMRPLLQPQSYVFVSVSNVEAFDMDKVFARINEPEGVTLVLTKQQAVEWQLEYASEFSLITLQIHSSLDAVGLTAAFSSALAKHGISANVIAGFYHDHILVAKQDANKAIDVLETLAQQAG
ncbi:MULTISPECIES: ACT domain-containing protein [Pseudoalteromonas]|uniref:ACT domain-containing protein n=1 Tax=Pseudoalteromonas TaxID=53246 RepID=UPI00026CD262|nr:ACT domain-containing protein [Pseudoalteromonas spongiae]ATC97541.1 hypothetical protein PSPO_a0309 [Pseudoalteromonas spongiae UST010723-006]